LVPLVFESDTNLTKFLCMIMIHFLITQGKEDLPYDKKYKDIHMTIVAYRDALGLSVVLSTVYAHVASSRAGPQPCTFRL
jgi:hypothetical protein